MKLRHSAAAYFLGLCLILFFPCSCKKQEVQFSESLRQIDNYALTGTREDTFKKLSRLRKKAGTGDQFLSIAKREYQLHNSDAAITTLKKGLQKIPHFELAALLTSIAIETECYDIAMPYIFLLKGTDYQSLGSELLFKNAALSMQQRLDYDMLMAGFHNTADQAFLVDAALALISNGKLPDALALLQINPPVSSQYPYFWSMLAFDLGKFSVIFDQLPYTLADYNIGGEGHEVRAEKTKAHILLAADGAYGLGNIDTARAYWQMYIDMFSDHNPLVYYDLALTSADVRERSKALSECVKNFPNFYPATARYVRDYVAYYTGVNKDAGIVPDDIDTILSNSGFYSLDMERQFLESQFLDMDPNELLSERAGAAEADPRFALELITLRLQQGERPENLAASVWQALERYPESSIVRSFAKWFFCMRQDIETAVNIPKTEESATDSFYTGVQASLTGQTDTALTQYQKAFDKEPFQCAARVNYACTQGLLGNIDTAIDFYTDALSYTQDDCQKSKIHYRIAELLVSVKNYRRAKNVLQYALQLDCQNYQAQALLTEISATVE